MLHEYLNVVVNRRLSDARVAQRQVLYLGEINANQREAWRKTVEVQEQGSRRQVELFPAASMPVDDVDGPVRRTTQEFDAAALIHIKMGAAFSAHAPVSLHNLERRS